MSNSLLEGFSLKQQMEFNGLRSIIGGVISLILLIAFSIKYSTLKKEDRSKNTYKNLTIIFGVLTGLATIAAIFFYYGSTKV